MFAASRFRLVVFALGFHLLLAGQWALAAEELFLVQPSDQPLTLGQWVERANANGKVKVKLDLETRSADELVEDFHFEPARPLHFMRLLAEKADLGFGLVPPGLVLGDDRELPRHWEEFGDTMVAVALVVAEGDGGQPQGTLELQTIEPGAGLLYSGYSLPMPELIGPDGQACDFKRSYRTGCSDGRLSRYPLKQWDAEAGYRLRWFALLAEKSPPITVETPVQTGSTVEAESITVRVLDAVTHGGTSLALSLSWPLEATPEQLRPLEHLAGVLRKDPARHADLAELVAKNWELEVEEARFLGEGHPCSVRTMTTKLPGLRHCLIWPQWDRQAWETLDLRLIKVHRRLVAVEMPLRFAAPAQGSPE